MLAELLKDDPDPSAASAEHRLVDVVFLAFAALLCGAIHYAEMATFAETRLGLLRLLAPMKHGAPNHHVFSRVLTALDTTALDQAFLRFTTAFGKALEEGAGAGASDTATLKHAYDQGSGRIPPITVAVFPAVTVMSLSSTAAGEGGGIKAAVAAMKLIALGGATVAGGELFCDPRMAKAIVEGGGDYALRIKSGRSKLFRDASAALDSAERRPEAAEGQIEEDTRGAERWRAFVADFAQAPGKGALAGVAAVARVERWRAVDEKTGHELRCFALSRLMAAAEALAVVRRRWSDEGRPDDSLDVILADQTRARADRGAANLASLRKVALKVLRADPRQIPLTHKSLLARGRDDELLGLLSRVR
jgi:hypothetical protein